MGQVEYIVAYRNSGWTVMEVESGYNRIFIDKEGALAHAIGKAKDAVQDGYFAKVWLEQEGNEPLQLQYEYPRSIQ